MGCELSYRRSVLYIVTSCTFTLAEVWLEITSTFDFQMDHVVYFYTVDGILNLPVRHIFPYFFNISFQVGEEIKLYSKY